MGPYVLTVLFVLGLMIGSFLNVCVYRLPRDESVLFVRSECTECGETIAWYDNIPLLSYLILGGRCRYCDESISITYFLGELVTGLIFATVGYWWIIVGYVHWLDYTVLVAFIVVCVTIARIDYAEAIIPNEINYTFLVVGLAIGVFGHRPLMNTLTVQYYPDQLFFAIVGLLLGGGIFFALAVLSPLFYGKPALGMGDVKLMAAMGAWLGPKLILLTMILGSIIGAVVGSVLMFIQGRSLRTEIPFGPFLCLAGIVALLVGDRIVHWYLNLI